MNLSAPFIKRPVMTTFVMLAILIAGLIGFKKLPVSDLPTVENPSIKVFGRYKGATPETMVNLITIPLEKQLSSISGLKDIHSVSSRGNSSITLEFDFDKNMDEAARQVQSALTRAEYSLPRDMEQKPSYQREEASTNHIMYMLLTSSTASVAEMREFADLYITPRISRIEGVAQVDTFGAPYEIHIKLNPELMAQRKITLPEVLEALDQSHSELPLGVIKTGTRLLSLELQGKLKNVKEFENLVVAPGPIRLKDIGIVSDQDDEGGEFHYVTKKDNTLALILGVKNQGGSNAVAISESIQKILPQIRKELPGSVELKLWFDKAKWIKESIWDVELSLIFAFVLVVLVIFLSLGRISETLIPTLALPLSILGTFVAMYAFHFSLDLLSLLALTLCVGFVVDDAIVVLENIVRHHELGSDPMKASLDGSKQISFTVLSMTLSLVAVFIPLLFMGGVDGQLFREFSITLAVAILVSGFISLSLTPMLCSKILKGHSEQTTLQKNVAKANEWMSGWYGSTLKWCLGHPKSILLMALLLFAVTIPLFSKLQVNLTPEEDRGFIWTIVKIPKGLSADKRKVYQNKIETLLQSHPYIDNFVDISWDNTQAFFVRLTPEGTRPPQNAIVKELQSAIDAIPGTQAFLTGYQLFNLHVDIFSGGQYQLLVRGMESPEVMQGAEALIKKMREDPAFTFARLNVQNDDPKLAVQVNEEYAQKFGFSKRDVQSLLQMAYSGGHAAFIQKGSSQHKVYVELDKEFSNSPASLGKLSLKTREGNLVPLKSLATWSETLGSPTLNRHDQLAAVTVNFSVNPEVQLNEALEKVEELATETLPAGVSGKLYGTAEVVANTMNETFWLLLASALVMYVVLGILYESFLHPVTILSSLPFAGLGGVLTLMLFGEPLSIFSIVGFLLLIGIVKKNGIMIVDYALEALKGGGVTSEQAIYEGCMVRFRPIMMTTIAAIMGALPIAIGVGDGAETRRGLGLVIVGGLIFSQMLTLYVTPIFFLTLEKLKAAAKRRLKSAEG